MIYHFEELGSTNDEAQKEIYGHGDVIVAERQSAGRGQRGNKWLSGEGLNLTLSAVLCPEGVVDVRNQFLILQATALAICDMLHGYGLAPKIKWTNDIYIGDKKIVGILIENKLSSSRLVRSIIGIGINVNQCEFDPALPNPTSMALESNHTFRREEVLESLSEAINRRFEMLAKGAKDKIAMEYHRLIYRVDQLHPFRLPSGGVEMGMIRGVQESGELIIDWQQGTRGEYLFGGVEFIIESRKKI